MSLNLNVVVDEHGPREEGSLFQIEEVCSNNDLRRCSCRIYMQVFCVLVTYRCLLQGRGKRPNCILECNLDAVYCQCTLYFGLVTE